MASAASAASSGAAIKAAEMGSALYSSFSGLLEKNLDTAPVANVHALITRCVQTIDPTMTPYLFGSTAVYGYHEPGTDADFVVLSREDVLDGMGADPSSEVAKGVQSDLLAKLTGALQKEQQGSGSGAIWQADLVRRTRVPVLRVKGGAGGSGDGSGTTTSLDVDFDITANRRNGVRNSALLRGYFCQQPHTRWLSIAVKRWSKRSGLNMGVEGGCLTSYGFNIMVAYYLLRRGLVQFVPPESCDVARILPMPLYLPLDPPASGGAELGAMTLDFLDFYLHEFDPETEVISLSRPRGAAAAAGRDANPATTAVVDSVVSAPFTVTTKEDLQWTKQAEDMARISGDKTSYRWCIEDPYEHNLNVGRHMTPFKLMLLKKHMERARDTALLLKVPPPPPPAASPAGGRGAAPPKKGGPLNSNTNQ